MLRYTVWVSLNTGVVDGLVSERKREEAYCHANALCSRALSRVR